MLGLKPQDLDVQIYRRADNNSITYVGENLERCIREMGFKVSVWPIGGKIVDAKVARSAELALFCGLIKDLHFKAVSQYRVAALVSEYPLTEYEVEKVSEAGLHEIWVPSEHSLKHFVNAGFKQVVVIPHGVEDLPISPKFESDTFNFLMIFNSYPCMNSHVMRKNVFKVIEAFEKAQSPVSKLMLRTEKRSYYHKYANVKNLEFVGYQKDLTDLFNKTHCLITPSESEGFGLVGLESLIRGVPIISTKTGNDYLEEASYSYIRLENGFTVEMLMNAMKKMYVEYEVFKDAILGQRHNLFKKYKWSNISNNYISCRLNNLLGL